MDYEGFKEKFVEDLKEKLEDAGIEAKLSLNTVKKLNDSYEAVTITPEDSNLGMNLPIEMKPLRMADLMMKSWIRPWRSLKTESMTDRTSILRISQITVR